MSYHLITLMNYINANSQFFMSRWREFTAYEYYTDDTDYAFPSEIREYYTNSEGQEQYHKTTYTYDMVLGKVKTVTDNNNKTTTYDYDNLGRKTLETYPAYEYYTSDSGAKENMYAKRIVNYYDRISEEHTPKYEESIKLLGMGVEEKLIYYDLTDPENPQDELVKHTIDFYDGFGNIFKKYTRDIINWAYGFAVSKYFYNECSLLEKIIAPLDNITEYSYDNAGRLTETKDDLGNLYVTRFNLKQDAPGSKSISYFINANDIQPNGTYEDNNRKNIVENYYDIYGRVAEKRAYKQYSSDYVTEEYDYDIIGNVVGYTDAKGNKNSLGYTTYNEYDGLNRLVYTTNAKDERTEIIYDTQGNITTIYMKEPNKPQQKLFTKTYDEQGRMLTDQDPFDKIHSFEHEHPNGLLSQSTDRNQTSFDYEYDNMNQITQSTALNEYGVGFINKNTSPYGPNKIWDMYYVPDGGGYSGSLFGMVDNAYTPTGKNYVKTSSYIYDPSILGINKYRYSAYHDNGYDALGRITDRFTGRLLDDGSNVTGSATNYHYNGIRLEKVQLNGAVTKNTDDSVNAKYDFYADGKLKTITYPALNGGEILQSTYTYDALGRLDTLVNKIGSTVISEYDYDCDDNGNIEIITETVNGVTHTTNLTYDKLNRLESSQSTKGYKGSYTYDFRGNREMEYSDPNLITSETNIYAYDELNRLWGVAKGGVTTYNDYTADGLRFYKQVDSQRTYYYYDLLGRVNAEGNSTGQPTASYIWGPDRTLAKRDFTSGTTYYYIYNGHGDVVQMVDLDGNIVNNYDYDPWGNFVNKQENVHNPFTYFGQMYDESTGLYYLRARFYDPTVGRFISEDSYEGDINNTLSLNRYTYGHNNPVMYTDPSGHFSIESAALVGIGLYELSILVYQYGPQVIEWLQQIAQHGPQFIDGMNNAGKNIASKIKEKFGGGSSQSDPGKDPSNLKKAMDNIRVMKDTKIGQYKVSMDLERGGSGLINIHLKIGNTKYFYNTDKGLFLDSLGNRVPNALRENQQIIDALNKAQKLIKGGF